MAQRITYRCTRVTYAEATVTLVVTEAELDTLTHSELEKRAIAAVEAWAEPETYLHGPVSYRADILHREKAEDPS